jgi:thioredoxin-related protein
MSSSTRREAARSVAFEEAFARAKTEHKSVLVDVYTDWCSWCRKMDAETYANASVRTLLDAKFLVVKLNAESQTEIVFNGQRVSMADFARQSDVTGYPTTLFFDANGHGVVSLPGYFDATRFTKILTYVADGRYTSMNLDQYLSDQR